MSDSTDTSLWSDERISNATEQIHLFGPYVVHHGVVRQMRDEYEAVLQQATEQQVAWEPVPDGFIYDGKLSDRERSLWVIGDELSVEGSDIAGEWSRRTIELPDGVRLCRLVQRPAASGEKLAGAE